MAKHAKNTTAQAIARTGARTTASVAVAAAGLLALSGVANAGGEDTVQITDVDGAGGGGGGQQGNSADGLVPILNNNDIAVNANVCDVLNNANVDIIEVLSDIDLDLLSESAGGDDAVVGDTGCSIENEQNDTNTSVVDDSIIVGGGGKDSGGKGGGGKDSGGKGGGGKGSEDDQVSKKPSGGVDTGDGSTSETDGIAYLLGGLALTAAGGTAFAARRTARQNS